MTILVIGAGSIGKRHYQNLRTLGADAEQMSWRASGQEGLVARLARGGLTGAVVATETQTHLDVATLCADSGLPLYIEKPLDHAPFALRAACKRLKPVAKRSMVGYMMRYHPAFQYLASADLQDIYHYSFDIGHDVTQWRANWSFADSYAARINGGGVLLDLCHELDMAICLFPAYDTFEVNCLGHRKYHSVDFASCITMNGPALGVVTMDYLSPISTRRIELLGRERRYTFDLIAGSYTVAHTGGVEVLDFPVERNDLFLMAMQDFLNLIAGRPTREMAHFPRLDQTFDQCMVVAAAYQQRIFTGHIEGDKP